jgi:putative ATPase
VEQDYLPEGLRGRVYYEPTDRGFEATLRQRLQNWWKRHQGR